jgi:hypothetical protein
MTTTNRTNTQGKDQQLINGIQKNLEQMSSLALGGTTYTPATLVAFIQSRIDAANQVATAKATWQHAGTAYLALNKQADVVVHDLKQLVIAAFGGTSPKLADFGFAPRKVTVLTPEEKAAAAAKRAATRAARGTKGPKAKLAIKGTVPATEPATAAQPAAPTAPTAPAGTAATQAAQVPQVTSTQPAQGTGGAAPSPEPTAPATPATPATKS